MKTRNPKESSYYKKGLKESKKVKQYYCAYKEKRSCQTKFKDDDVIHCYFLGRCRFKRILK